MTEKINNRSWLNRKYNQEDYSQRDIANVVGCSESTVSRKMKELNVPTRLTKDLEDRFWEKVDRGDPDECWEWQAGTAPGGYGLITKEGESEIATRVVWELKYDEKPGDLNVLHKCDNPPCVNPSHLYLGDQSDNLFDHMEAEDRNYGEDHPGAKLTENQVKDIRRKAEEGTEREELAKEYEVTVQNISAVVRKDSWTHI